MSHLIMCRDPTPIPGVSDTRECPQPMTDRAAYVTRLRAFIRLLLDSGCDVSDALQFEQHQIEKMRIEKRDVWSSDISGKRRSNRLSFLSPLSWRRC
jgi:integrase